jgi:hypothetical protein
MSPEYREVCVKYLERVIERVKNDEFYDMCMTEKKPMVPNEEGEIVRDSSRARTLDISIKVKG